MKRLLLIFISWSVLLAGCSKNNEDAARKGVLNEHELSALLIDIYLAEAVADELPLPKDSSITYFFPYEQKLLKKKNIPDSVLKKTYAYYLSHPKEFEKVYDIVIDSLTVREQRTKTPHESAPKPSKPVRKQTRL